MRHLIKCYSGEERRGRHGLFPLSLQYFIGLMLPDAQIGRREERRREKRPAKGSVTPVRLTIAVSLCNQLRYILRSAREKRQEKASEGQSKEAGEREREKLQGKARVVLILHCALLCLFFRTRKEANQWKSHTAQCKETKVSEEEKRERGKAFFIITLFPM